MRVNGIKRAEKWTRFVLLSPKKAVVVAVVFGVRRECARSACAACKGRWRRRISRRHRSFADGFSRYLTTYEWLTLSATFSLPYTARVLYIMYNVNCAHFTARHICSVRFNHHLNPTCRKCHVFFNTDGSNIITYY